MSTLYLECNGDLKLSQQGGLVLASGWDELRQRILRRIFTNPLMRENGQIVPPGYIFHPEYGLGLGFVIGQTFNDEFKSQLTQRIKQGILDDSEVDKSVLPTISIRDTGFRRFEVHASFKPVNGLLQKLLFEISEV